MTLHKGDSLVVVVIVDDAPVAVAVIDAFSVARVNDTYGQI